MPSEEGGAGGREIVKLCIGCARGARSPRAREGGGARSRGALRAPRARGRARPARCARRPPGAPRAQRGRGASRSSAWRGRGRGAERAAALGGRTRGRQRGWESLARATELQHVTTAPNPARPGSCAFCVWEVCASSVPTAGAGGDRPSEKLPERRGQGGAEDGRLIPGLGSKCCT